MTVRTAIFPVGGLGTRFLPATKSMPKEMLPVVNKPLIQYAFEEAVQAGIERFIFVMGRNKNILSNHFDHAYELQDFLDEKQKAAELEVVKAWLPTPGRIAYVRQQEPLGLGHAVWCARHFLQDEAFAVLLADEMIISDGGEFLRTMMQTHADTGGNVVAVDHVAREDTKRYGIVDVKGNDGDRAAISAMVEKPDPSLAPSQLAIMGRYILNPSIIDALSHGKKGAGGEIQLTDAMQSLVASEPYYAQRFRGRRIDCGTPLGFLEANIACALDNPAMEEPVKALLRKYGAAS